MTKIELSLPPELAHWMQSIDEKLDRLAEATIPDLWTVEDLARHLNCHVDTVRRKARDGEYLIAKRVGHKMLFDPDNFTQA